MRKRGFIILVWLVTGAAVSARAEVYVSLSGPASARTVDELVYQVTVGGEPGYNSVVKVRFTLSVDPSGPKARGSFDTFRSQIVANGLSWSCETSRTAATCVASWSQISYLPNYRQLRFTQRPEPSWCGRKIKATATFTSPGGSHSATATTQLTQATDPRVSGSFQSQQVAPGSVAIAAVWPSVDGGNVVRVTVPANTTYVGVERPSSLSTLWTLQCSPVQGTMHCQGQLTNCYQNPPIVPEQLCNTAGQEGWRALVKFKVNEGTAAGTVLKSIVSLNPLTGPCADSNPANNSVTLSATVSPSP